jgi:hypothetical protein
MNKEAITAINCIMNIKISRFVFKLDTFPKPNPLIKYPTLMHREVENPRVSVGNSSKVVTVKMLLTIYKAARVEIVTTYLV